MKFTYIKDGQVVRTEASNDDVRFIDESSGERTTIRVEALTDITLRKCRISVPYEIHRSDCFFMNGYQSWTDSHEYRYSDYQRNLNKLPKKLVEAYAFGAYGDQWFNKKKNFVLHAIDFSYARGKNPYFAGNYNYRNAYLIIELYKRWDKICFRSDIEGKKLKAGETFTIYDFVFTRNQEKGMKDYFALLTPKSNDKLFGYTSWYNHYENISEEIILKALDEADDRFDLFQIDDGFEPHVGDWMKEDEKKFPHGLRPIVDRIHEKGMKAGIWLAPFGVNKNSELIKEHPEWIARNKEGKFIDAGSNWNGFCPLDMNNPEAVQHIRDVLNRFMDMGFDFFKLDFLYSCNLKPLEGKTRSETSEFAYQLLADTLKGKLILGCGATMSNAYGKFDYMRVGPDVSLKYDDLAYMRIMHRERVSTKVTLQNTLFRSPLNHHAFLNDPDVFLLRDDNIRLTPDQRYALTKINSLFGSLLMTSDNPKEYDESKRKVLDEALDIFRNATDPTYEKKKGKVFITYKLHDKDYSFVFNIRKGVIKNG